MSCFVFYSLASRRQVVKCRKCRIGSTSCDFHPAYKEEWGDRGVRSCVSVAGLPMEVMIDVISDRMESATND